jgi:hypothetical protein
MKIFRGNDLRPNDQNDDAMLDTHLSISDFAYYDFTTTGHAFTL